MARDAALAEEAQPTVRCFTWSPPAVSLGWKQIAPAWVERVTGQLAGVDSVERPTGGGIAFHGSDVSIAIVVPRRWELPLASIMQTVCESARRLCGAHGLETTCAFNVPADARITYCLTQPSAYALFAGERKLAGFALRRYPNSWLVQGSLLIRPIPAPLSHRIPEELRCQLQARAISLSEATHSMLDERTVAVQWAQQWSSWWHSDFTDFNMLTPTRVMTDSYRGASTPSSTISV